jgi:Fe-Mn family superoxide dismutase
MNIFEMKPLPFDYDALEGISEKQIRYHHDKHYLSYVNNRNDIEQKLNDAREKGDFSAIRTLKLNESHNASGMILHELYFDCLGGKGGKPIERLADKIDQDFGSFDNWKKEFLAIAKSSRGWVLLCFDPSDDRLHNFSVDFHDIGAVWGTIPILALDVWEHAYYIDYGPDKEKYFETFFNNLDWGKVSDNFDRI